LTDLHRLPALNAALNALTALWLVGGLIAIKRRRIRVHRAFMLTAVITSSLFLASYIVYHAHAGTTRFQSHGWIRPTYFTILITHTVLAAAVVPLVAVTLTRARRRRYPAHRRLARITWPVWAYVSVTGILVYFFLYHLDPRLALPH
jgi:putative membrane protein